MADYNQKQYNKYGTIKQNGEEKLPMGDKVHARAALARMNQVKPALTHEQKMKVLRKAKEILGAKHVHKTV